MDMKKIYNEMVKKAYSDPKFKQDLLNDAKTAFKKMGIDFGGDIKVSVFESTPEHLHFVLPVKA